MNTIFDSNVHPLYTVMAFISAMIVGLIYYSSTKNLLSKSTKHKLIYAWVIFFCIQDGVWGLFASWTFRNSQGLYIASYAFHASAILSPVFWTIYFLSRVRIRKYLSVVFISVSALLSCAQFWMLFRNISTQFMFYVDAEGFYRTTPYRSIMFYLQFAMYICMAVISFWAYFKYEKGTGQNNLFAIAAVTSAPIFFGAFQMIYPEAPYDSVGFAVACVVIHCYLSIDYEKQVYDLNELKNNLDAALKAARAANKAKSTFLFNMSHDIRTPMNAIIGFTNLAEKNLDDPEKVRDCLKKTKVSSDLLLSLINDVLEMSRIESGKAELSNDKCDAMHSFYLVDTVLGELAKAKNIDITFKYGEIPNRYILADKMRFNRVLLNLGTNAIKYTPNGGKVRLSVRQLGEPKDGVCHYEYIVTDNGNGMSEEFQAHMYEEFAREKSTTTSGIQGTGLGLSVSKAYVEMMGGSIECESKVGEGTTFTLVLPFTLREKDEGDLDDLELNSDEDRMKGFKGKRILLVEDNELNREIATDLLEEADIIVETAEDGRKAVDMILENGASYYDLILMDIQMPVMDGYEATRTIREMYPNKHIPIIALSANAFAEDKEKSRKAGMDDHVEKPIKVTELFGTMRRVLR